MKPKDLRDEFAMSALPEVIRDAMADLNNGRTLSVAGNPCTVDVYIASLAMNIARCMMAEREKNNEAD